MKYELKTHVYKDGEIEQLLHEGNTQLARWVIETREAGIKQALIALGWKPPEVEDDGTQTSKL